MSSSIHDQTSDVLYSDTFSNSQAASSNVISKNVSSHNELDVLVSATNTSSNVNSTKLKDSNNSSEKPASNSSVKHNENDIPIVKQTQTSLDSTIPKPNATKPNNEDMELIQLQDLKSQLVRKWQFDGFVDSLRSTIRAKLVSDLQNYGHTLGLPYKIKNMSIHDRLINTLIINHFQSKLMKYSLSVFVSEIGGESAGSLSIKDLFDLLTFQFNKSIDSSLLDQIIQTFQLRYKKNSMFTDDNDIKDATMEKTHSEKQSNLRKIEQELEEDKQKLNNLQKTLNSKIEVAKQEIATRFDQQIEQLTMQLKSKDQIIDSLKSQVCTMSNDQNMSETHSFTETKTFEKSVNTNENKCKDSVPTTIPFSALQELDLQWRNKYQQLYHQYLKCAENEEQCQTKIDQLTVENKSIKRENQQLVRLLDISRKHRHSVDHSNISNVKPKTQYPKSKNYASNTNIHQESASVGGFATNGIRIHSNEHDTKHHAHQENLDAKYAKDNVDTHENAMSWVLNSQAKLENDHRQLEQQTAQFLAKAQENIKRLTDDNETELHANKEKTVENEMKVTIMLGDDVIDKSTLQSKFTNSPKIAKKSVKPMILDSKTSNCNSQVKMDFLEPPKSETEDSVTPMPPDVDSSDSISEYQYHTRNQTDMAPIRDIKTCVDNNSKQTESSDSFSGVEYLQTDFMSKYQQHIDRTLDKLHFDI